MTALVLLVALWGAVNIALVITAKAQTARLVYRRRSAEELEILHELDEELLDGLDALYQLDHHKPPPPHFYGA